MPPPQTSPIACQTHNHQLCIDTALQQAKVLCQDRGVRLTTLREQVLRLIWSSHKPLGAYTLMDMLAEDQTRRVAPPTVYRALDFLREQHFIHKIHSLNAYVGCNDPQTQHQGHFLICQHCGIAVESGGDSINKALMQTAKALGFQAQQQCVEILGACPACVGDQPA